MGIKDILRRIRFEAERETGGSDLFVISPDSVGLNFVADPASLANLRRGEGSREALEQFVLLRMLVEQGAAQELPTGFEIPTSSATRFSDEEATVLGLPERFPGQFLTEVKSHTNSTAFRVSVRTRVGEHPEPWSRKGPIITVGERDYLLSPPMVDALQAVEHHLSLPLESRTEAANVELISRLQAAKSTSTSATEDADAAPGWYRPLEIDLKHLDRWTTHVPEAVGIIAEQRADGSLRVSPTLGGDIDPASLDNRWHQVAHGDSGVLRVGQTLVLLDEEKLAGVREVLSNRVIPKHQVKAFFEAPGAFIDASLVNLDMGFSVRVLGVGEVDSSQFANQSSSGLNWFGHDGMVIPADAFLRELAEANELEEVRQRIEQAWANGDEYAFIQEKWIDVSDHEAVVSALAAADVRLRSDAGGTSETPQEGQTKVRVGLILDDDVTGDPGVIAAARAAHPPMAIDYSALRRSPLDHQREGVEWMTSLMCASLESTSEEMHPIQGAILADDMGLGKTYMTLVALREFIAHQVRLGEPNRPTLVVLPLSLIENWEEEIVKTFHESPFRDVVVLQSDRDLGRFRVRGAARETAAPLDAIGDDGFVREDAIRFSLRIGPDWGSDRLDVDGRLVLTTYDALRNFQLSFGQVDWGVVVFDEAQNIKDPVTLRTRAAKGLKARFKLLATGTPIENSIMDLWCLMDTAQPGFLGTWAQFRDRWGEDIEGADSLDRAGAEVRSYIGPLMLRRTKAEKLKGLPPKVIHTGVDVGDQPGYRFDASFAALMPPPQQKAYDSEIGRYQAKSVRSPGDALKTLQNLRSISLHPHLQSAGPGLDSPDAASHSAARVAIAFRVLDRVQAAGEKAIVFVIDRRMQRHLAVWIQQRYGILTDVVNGETAAVSKRGGVTRRSLIEKFEAADGFNVIIMSPIAVGVGLTVVGANHAVFLERTWNPAKEAQATDRIYRIGQKRPVNIYMPIAQHPTLMSFDLTLDALLRQKMQVNEAVMVPEAGVRNEMMSSLGLLGQSA